MRKMWSKNQIEELSKASVEEMRQNGELSYQGQAVEIQSLYIDDETTIGLVLTNEQKQIIDKFNLFHVQYVKYNGAIHFAIVLKNKYCPSVALDEDYLFDHTGTIKLVYNDDYYLSFNNDEAFIDVSHDIVYITPII